MCTCVHTFSPVIHHCYCFFTLPTLLCSMGPHNSTRVSLFSSLLFLQLILTLSIDSIIKDLTTHSTPNPSCLLISAFSYSYVHVTCCVMVVHITTLLITHFLSDHTSFHNLTAELTFPTQLLIHYFCLK